MKFYKIIYKRYSDRIKNLYYISEFFLFEESKEKAIKRFLKVNDEVRRYDIKEVVELSL